MNDFLPDADIWQTCIFRRSYMSRFGNPGVTFFWRELDRKWWVACNGSVETTLEGTLAEAEAVARKALRRELFAALRQVEQAGRHDHVPAG